MDTPEDELQTTFVGREFPDREQVQSEIRYNQQNACHCERISVFSLAARPGAARAAESLHDPPGAGGAGRLPRRSVLDALSPRAGSRRLRR